MMRSMYFIAAVLSTCILSAQPGIPPGNAPHNGQTRSIKEELALTDEQDKKMQEVLSSVQKNDDIRNRMIALKREDLNLEEEMIKAAPDAGKIRTIIERKMKIAGEMEFARMKTDIDIKVILKPEQFARWKNMQSPQMSPHHPGTDKPGERAGRK